MRIAAFFLFFLIVSPASAQDLGFIKAGNHNGVNPHTLEAISWNESSLNPDISPSRNERISKNGKVHVSHDFTHMQINDHYWKAKIDEIDPRLWDLMLKDPKVASIVGGWIFSLCVKQYGNNWHAVAAYNTGRSIDLHDCLMAFDSYRRDRIYTREQLKAAQERVERGRAYARRAYDYLVAQGHYTAPAPIPEILVLPSERTTVLKGRGLALPIRAINLANNGRWRPLE